WSSGPGALTTGRSSIRPPTAQPATTNTAAAVAATRRSRARPLRAACGRGRSPAVRPGRSRNASFIDAERIETSSGEIRQHGEVWKTVGAAARSPIVSLAVGLHRLPRRVARGPRRAARPTARRRRRLARPIAHSRHGLVPLPARGRQDAVMTAPGRRRLTRRTAPGRHRPLRMARRRRLVPRYGRPVPRNAHRLRGLGLAVPRLVLLAGRADARPRADAAAAALVQPDDHRVGGHV